MTENLEVGKQGPFLEVGVGGTTIHPSMTSPLFTKAEATWEFRLSRIARLIKALFQVENVYIRLVGADGNWIRLESGHPIYEDKTGHNLCDYAILEEEILAVADVDTDLRLLSGELENDVETLKSYVGHSLATPSGEHVGVLCAWGTKPKEFSSEQLEMFDDVVFWVQREVLNVRDFDRATEVQQGLIPKKIIDLPGFDMAGYFQPAQSVGGDFYDWYESPTGATFTLADVMGKGIGAAIMAATVRAVLRAASSDHTAPQVLKIAHEILDPDLNRAGTFVTLVYGKIDHKKSEISYVDAGHGLVLVVRKNGQFERIASQNLPLGVAEVEDFEAKSIILESGDSFVVLSDGMLDVFDGGLEFLDQIADLTRASKDAHEIIDTLIQLSAYADAPDDVTAIAIRKL